MLKKALRLWVICRFLEGKWRFWGDEFITSINPKNPWRDWDSLPPYVDYQVASLFIQRILMPLRKDVLTELQSLMDHHRSQDWFITFLTSFVLLHNYELQIGFQAAFAKRRNSKVGNSYAIRT
jgi:hypothetical protein